MKRVFKYQLETTDEQSVPLPAGAEILSVGEQFGTICLWALVDPTAARIDRKIWIHGTGHEVTAENLKFLGTVLLRGGCLVFHVFEETH